MRFTTWHGKFHRVGFLVCMLVTVTNNCTSPFFVKGGSAPFSRFNITPTNKPLPHPRCTMAIAAMDPQPDKSHGFRRNGWSQNLAKVALIVALAGNADAFRPLALRSITPSTKVVSGRQQLPTLGLRQQASKPRFLFGLRAAVAETFSREKMYQLAQVINSFRISSMPKK
jgi:hypothetical protein